MIIPIIPPSSGNDHIDQVDRVDTVRAVDQTERSERSERSNSETSRSSDNDAGVYVMPSKRAKMSHVVRELTLEERKKLEPLFADRGVEMPNPATSTIIGAVDRETGEVSNNFIVGQLMLHAEPLHLEPGCGHLFRPLARSLYDKIAEKVGTVDVFLFAPDGKVSQMAESMGMNREPWNVYSTTVYGNAPEQKD